MNMQNRDHQGRFLAKGQKCPVIENVHRRISESDRLARLYFKLCELIRPEMVEYLEIKQCNRGWDYGSAAKPFFLGVYYGIAFVLAKRKDVCEAVSLLDKAAAIEKNISRLYQEYGELIKGKP